MPDDGSSGERNISSIRSTKKEYILRHITRSQGITWGLTILGLFMLLVGAANHVSARLGPWGHRTGENHTRENQTGKDLAGKDLAGIDLSGAGISETNVSEVSLADADFTNTNLDGTDFTHASVGGSLFDTVMLTPETIFRKAILSGVDLVNLGVHASGISRAGSPTATGFQHANLLGLHLAGFDGLALDGASVSHATQWSSGLASGQNANFTGANLQDAWSDAADVTNPNITNADVQFPRMDEGGFSGANFTNAGLQFAALLQASFDKAVVTGAKLDAAALSSDSTGADFTGASIYGATLEPYNDYTRPDLTAAISTPIVHNPEPSTLLLLGTGLAGLFGYGWRRQRQVA